MELVWRLLHYSHDHAALSYLYPGIRSASRTTLTPLISLVSHTDLSDLVSSSSFVCWVLKRHIVCWKGTYIQNYLAWAVWFWMISANVSSHTPIRPHPPLFRFQLDFCASLLLFLITSVTFSSHNPRRPCPLSSFSFVPFYLDFLKVCNYFWWLQLTSQVIPKKSASKFFLDFCPSFS